MFVFEWTSLVMLLSILLTAIIGWGGIPKLMELMIQWFPQMTGTQRWLLTQTFNGLLAILNLIVGGAITPALFVPLDLFKLLAMWFGEVVFLATGVEVLFQKEIRPNRKS